MTLLPTFITLGSAFAASSQPPSEEARQTAARVRTSMLTQDWSWCRELSPDRVLEVTEGLFAFFQQKPSADRMRLW